MRLSIFIIFLASLLFTGCSSQEVAIGRTDPPLLADLGKAPELTNATWFNTTEPLRLSNLQGKVVIIEMWTFTCVNCRNVIPFLKAWHEQYASKGLVIIGNHYPEFEHESVLENLKQAVNELEIPYAVAEDNLGETWQAYNTHFWPTLYLIDKKGQIRYIHMGEGQYKETEAAIIELLEES